MRVLLAEDDENSRAFLEAALTAAGHEVVATRDGIEALARARDSAFDLIVSDILMPGMDGFDLCRVIKGDDALSRIPFVFYTATYIDRRDQRLGLALGADRFLIKPMEVTDLLGELESVVRETRAGGDARSPADPSTDLTEDLDAEQLKVVSQKLAKKVGELQRANAEIRRSEHRFQQLVENIHECFWMIDAETGALIYGSPAMRAIWGFDADERMADPGIWLARIHPTDRPAFQRGYLEDTRDGPTERTFRVVKPSGEVRWLRERTFPVRGDDDTVYRIAGLTEDVSETRRLADRLTFHANHDTLTGLLNRRVFEQQLTELTEARLSDEHEHALCYIDLDQFKVVNDSCGHPAGDQLLRDLAKVIASKVRKTDTLARLGGDEFGVLMSRCSVHQADRLADEIISAVSEYRFQRHGATYSVGASIGLVMLQPNTSVRNALASADAACYVAKEQGGNRRHIYRDDDEALLARHGEIQWVSRLTDALDQCRFELHFQGIHDTRAPAVRPTKVEVLLRLREPDGELVSPDQFMPAAHRYQLAQRIDNYVIDRACRWLASEGSWVEICAVNLSAPSLSDRAIVDTVRSALATSGVDGRRLCLEITETAALGSLSQVGKLMHSVRELGCRFSVDDFGSGFSSFAYLKALPIDFLKIDGQFVVDLGRDPLEEVMVRSINDIGHAIGTQTIAEWVEDAQTLRILNEIGVDFAQGFHLSRPRPCWADDSDR